MKTSRNSARRSAALTAPALILIALLSCLSAGCGRRVTYVSGSHKLTHLKQGQPAPEAGVLMSEEYLSEIFETLGK